MSEILSAGQPEDFFGSTSENLAHRLLTYTRNTAAELSDKFILGIRDLSFDGLLCDAMILRAWGDALRNALSQKIIAVNPALPERLNVSTSGVTEVVLCPQEIEIPQGANAKAAGSSRPFYAEPSVLTERQAIAFPWHTIAPGRSIVYCSLGTQYARYRQAPEILKSVVQAFSALPEYQLVIAAGSMFDGLARESLPKNVVIVRTAPQLDLLKRSKLFITHGGLGGIKEAIISGAPVLVIPFDTDQPHNAARVLHHKLGRLCLPSQCTPERLKHLVQAMLENNDMSASLRDMRRVFCDREAQAPSVPFIEQEMATSEARRS